MDSTAAVGNTSDAVIEAARVVEDCRRFTMYDWSVQSTVQPLGVRAARGVRFETLDGRSILDFNSQLMGVNIGHADPRVGEAIIRQVTMLPYINPSMAHEARARVGRMLAEVLPGDINKVLLTLSGADANEHAVKIARMYTGRRKVLALYRSYHGSTGGAINLTGDPRRWSAETEFGVVHLLGPHHWPGEPVESAASSLARVHETILLEGPESIAAFIIEPVVGTNGILIPPDGYLEGVRELCTEHGIVLIADEVMTGFGRTGEWFAVNHWGVVPDIITLAKGLTSGYVPLGAVGLRAPLAEYFENRPLTTGMTYGSHPVACAAAAAVIQVYHDDGLVENARRLGEVMGRHHEDLARQHPCVGAVRNIGLFGLVELFEDGDMTRPLVPFNGSGKVMAQLESELLSRGLYTIARWHTLMTNPPLSISDDDLALGFEIIDDALTALSL